jgi:hypothetical protein
MTLRRPRLVQAVLLVVLLVAVIMTSAPPRASATCGISHSLTVTYWLDATCVGVPPHRICQNVEPSVVGECTTDCDGYTSCWGDNDPNLRQTFSSESCPDPCGS